MGDAFAGYAFSRLVLNLESVSFIDSTGLGALVGVWRRLRPLDGALGLAAATFKVRGVFETAGLTKPLPIYPGTAEALLACRPAGQASS